MNRFEQLIEYVINDETQKARELFHEIVVEKSRQIYEDIMSEEAEEELEEAAEEELEEAEEVEEGAMGGDAADDLIDDVEMDEESDINMEEEEEEEGEEVIDGDDEEAEVEFGAEEGESDEAATKDDIMNLEDKLDELMAEFEQLMAGEMQEPEHADMAGDGDDFGAEEGGDAVAMDDTAEMMPMAEALSLKAAPKPVTSEEGSVNKKSTVAANSGAAGMAAKPVHTGADMGGKHDAAGAYSNSAKEVGVTATQDAGKGAFKTAAPKPVTSQASGVNTKSPLPGRKG